MPGATTATDTDDLARRVAAKTWYHTIERPGGITTPGEYDTGSALAHIPFPDDLTGKRCLDVGTHDGFWAFTMERRGADEVVALDIDDPTRIDFSEPVPVLSPEMRDDREGRPAVFRLAHEALGSRVDRRDLSVYDLTAEAAGEFDFAYLGTLLLHLRDPVAALTRVRHVLKPGGRMLVNDPISLEMTLLHPRRPAYTLALLPGRPFWWMPNVAGLRRYMEKAGFRIVDSGGPYWLKRGPGYARPREATAWQRLVFRRGMPHGWVLGEAA
jgi:tRNA (mo5U34)-methyltransferase